ncbi:MAG: GNAT family N-acetyltransferase [Clostridia bacterium]|nr:GNAT family N-acetyltransferase [Clostridia bacterium]
MIKLVSVKAEEKERFRNINQKYLYEMTSFYPDVMDEDGNYGYGYFDEYFVDPKRKAYFIYNDETMVGFVMINPYSVIGGEPDFTMAEFTIFPTYRRNGYAAETARLIFSENKGNWELKYNEKNKAAKALWTAVTASYNPRLHHLNETETVLEFTVR